MSYTFVFLTFKMFIREHKLKCKVLIEHPAQGGVYLSLRRK